MIAENFPLGAVTKSARLLCTPVVYIMPHHSISVALDFYIITRMSVASLDVVTQPIT